MLVVAHGIFTEDLSLQRAGCSLRRAGFSPVVACRFSLSSCDEQASGHVGSVACSTRALSLRRESSVVVVRGLSCPAVAREILVPQPGIEPTSPALGCRFFTTGPPGKSLTMAFKCNFAPLVIYSYFVGSVEEQETVNIHFEYVNFNCKS